MKSENSGDSTGAMLKTFRAFIKTDRFLAWFYGIGLLCFGLHSRVFTVYNSEGEVQFFPPMIGALILILVPVLLWNEKRITRETLGEKKIWIPIAIITVSIIIRSILTFNSESIAEIGIGVTLFSCYLMGRILGREIFYPLAVFVVIEIISVFIIMAGDHTKPTGGLWSETNYDGATGVIVLGTMLAVHRWQWILVIGMFIVGWFMASAECIVASFIIGCVMLWRRDWNYKLFAGVGIMLILASLWYFVGKGQEQYEWKVIAVTKDALGLEQYEKVYEQGDSKSYYNAVAEDGDGEYLATWGKGRLPAYERAIKETAPFGHEFDLYRYGEITGVPTVHNVPLVIWDQVGPVAAICWLWLILYCLVKTRWKYAFVAILSVSLVDHYVWSTLGPYWWCAVGVATAWSFNDYIWRKHEDKIICERSERDRASDTVQPVLVADQEI